MRTLRISNFSNWTFRAQIPLIILYTTQPYRKGVSYPIFLFSKDIECFDLSLIFIILHGPSSERVKKIKKR